MFAKLKDYIKVQSRIEIYTPYKNFNFEIIGTLLLPSDRAIYNIISSENPANDFIVQLKKILPDLEERQKAEKDQYITLSTCLDYNSEKRIVVIARKILEE